MARIAILGTNTAVAATASLAITVGTAVPVGSLVVVGAAWENAAAVVPTFVSVADSRSNTYGSNWDSSAGTGNGTVASALVSGFVTTALQVSDTVTLTISATRVRWAMEADAFDDPASSSPLDKTKANHNPGSDSNMTTTATTTLAQPRELLVAAFGGGVRTYTAGTGFTGGPSVDTAAGSSDRSLFLEYGYVEASTPGTATGTCTTNTAVTYCGCLATYKSWRANEPTVTGPSPANTRSNRW